MSDAAVPGFFEIASRRSVAMRAIRIALIVGTVIALINHGDRMATLTLDWNGVWKILLTYLVPYGVSTYSSVKAVRDQIEREAAAR